MQQPLGGMKLQEKEVQKDYHTQNLFSKNLRINFLLILDFKIFRS